jgi:hypothetical protein
MRRNLRNERRRKLARLRAQNVRTRDAVSEHVRALRRAKQQRYRARRAEGKTVVAPKVDPADLAEFLRSAGVMVLAADRETLALGIETLLAEWNEGRIRVTRIRDDV